MIFPIDKETFYHHVRDPKTHDDSIKIEEPKKWRYWMSDDGEPLAIFEKTVLSFSEKRVDNFDISSNSWNVDLIGSERPKDIILNHLFLGGYVYDNYYSILPKLKNGMYRLTCPYVKNTYDVWIETEVDEVYGSVETFLWWRGKGDLIHSIPLIYELMDFYKYALWKKL